MRKNILSFIIGSALLMTTSLTGCSGNNSAGADTDTSTTTSTTPVVTDGKKEVHLVAVIGSHANAPRPNLSLIEEDVYEACYTYGSVTIVCDDGDPYTLVIDIPAQSDNLSDTKYKQIANDQTKQILTVAGQMQAKTDQVNTLKSIQLGARSFGSAETESEDVTLVRKMVICDSCLSTTGALSFSEHNLNGISTEDIVNQLQEMDEIPALDDVAVTVYTCGDTAGEKQKALTETNRKALKAVWESILEAGNADVNMKDDLPLSSVYDESTLPSVSPVTVIQSSVDIISEEDVDEAFADGGVISFDETSIAFNPGTAEFANKEATKEALSYVKDYMQNHPDFKLLVAGTTACWGGKDYCMNLSNERANAICKLLSDDFGIAKERMQAVGLGYSFADFYTFDQTPDGKLDDDIAPVNRSVKLVELGSDTANRILSMK